MDNNNTNIISNGRDKNNDDQPISDYSNQVTRVNDLLNDINANGGTLTPIQDEFLNPTPFENAPLANIDTNLEDDFDADADADEFRPFLQQNNASTSTPANTADEQSFFPVEDDFAVSGTDDVSETDNTTRVRRRGRSNTMFSIRSGIDIVREQLDKDKFVLLILASTFLYIGFMAAFAPRTSLTRTFGWLHGSTFTKAETYRIFLTALQEENKAKYHVHNYATANKNGVHETGDLNTLHYTIDQFTELGFTTKQESYFPWLNINGETQVSLFHGNQMIFNASMIEDCLPSEDPSTCESKPHGYHSYSANGNVTAQYVFCNYGTLKDYKLLLNHDIDIEGKIHIIRNGNLLKGIKVKNAELFGASGVILYSDPYDDGYVTERNGFKPYPEGPARNPSAIERGSVQFLQEISGDPTSPGYPSKYKRTEHISPAGKIPNIPSVPMSAKEIQPILELLNGKGFQLGPGGYIDGFDYFTGPSDENTEVRVYNSQNYEFQKISNVAVEIPGIFAEGEIIIGARRDSLVSDGSSGSNSGSAILLEIARGISSLMKRGWKPLRPIKLISWDGSGPAHLGSTEYVEEYSAFLKRNVLAYLNLDSVIQGSLFMSNANPLLHDVIYEAAKYTSFKDNEDWTLYDEWKKMTNNTVGIIDGISDTNSFQNYLGIPSANFQFKNNGTGDAIWHKNSNFDTYTWLEQFIDPDYKLHNTMAKFVGLVTLTINQNDMIPFKTHSYLLEINNWYKKWENKLINSFPYDDELKELADNVNDIIEIATWTESILFDKITQEIKEDCSRDFPLIQFYKKIDLYMSLLRTNNKLRQLDKLFLTKRGLRDREWFKHSIFEPDKFIGSKGIVLTGLYEAIEGWSRDDAMEWLTILMIQFSNIRMLLQM
ncbi:hypothetical protein TBLA_0B06200 [Henningerozyma blattae CBS 6284]|uniref:Transferrin receptor-like dimerisation domain-containing protein n=1 Tax=Henningerozyma blattae (strain ATCC 34711 / CBS 6284 / DSM 70876 / NBRC 10599 / NRRL Y-10934 / UCD 77-7) TaxID=1071380 RepID=I2GZ93_HENB6|nr:hypothetical protein TBLA_0B06200 [Tetrapisispora blattae CBS 6284]CCH59445.1 hypothetical protein TBLA_0B06200 [Tetrapisispora blattae CBS 6284]